MHDRDIQPNNLTTTANTLLATLIAYSEKTQAAIAADAGISPAHLSRIIRGQTRPTDKTFSRILAATGAPLTIVALALIVGPDNLPLIVRSHFLTRLVEDLPNRLVQELGADIHDADPRWAHNIVEFVVRKTQETVARKREADTSFKLLL